MNEKVLETLEYDKIKQQLAAYLTTDRGNEILGNLRPSQILMWSLIGSTKRLMGLILSG